MSIDCIDRIGNLLLRGEQSPKYFKRADMDELMMLVEVLRLELPQRFIILVTDYEQNYIQDEDQLRQFSQRAIRILKVHGEFPAVVSNERYLETTPTFELNIEDKKRLFELCDQMRRIIFVSDIFDDPHKKRLLNRIAAIEAQVHQKLGLYDTILGGISDFGETMGKFGKDIKPLTDRMNEVVKITRRATKVYDQLPAPDEVKQLPPPSSDE